MKPTDDLFRLVRSMTGAEKRYFKLFSSIYERDKNYMLLFNAIEKQENVYDEAQVIEELKGEKWLSQLSKTKHQLYDFLLNSLEYYNRNSDVDSELKSYLHRVKILHDKGLHTQCEKILLKAKGLAEQHEKYNVLLDVLRWERIMAVIVNQDRYSFEKKTGAIYNERRAAIKKIQTTCEYNNIGDKVFSVSKGLLRSAAVEKALKKIIRLSLLQDENKAVTREAKRDFYSIYSLFYEETGNVLKSYFYQKKIAELLESSVDSIRELPARYLSSTYNLGGTLLQLAKYDELSLVIKKLRGIPEMLGQKCTESIKAKVFERGYHLEMEMYLSSCQFEKGIAIIPGIEKGLKEFQGKITKSKEIILYFNCALLYFIMQDYHKALAWNNKIINDATADVRQDAYCYARLLNLLIHYELGNEDILENLVKSAERYLDKKNHLYKTEKALLNFINKKIPVTFTGKERVAAFKELKTELEEITKDAFEKNALKDIDYIAWLESKIEGKSLAEVLREKTVSRSIRDETQN